MKVNLSKPMEMKVEPTEILKRPYARVLTPDEDGRVTAEVMEFPNCVAFGDNAAEALAKLEAVAADWIAAALEQGQSIPEPMAAINYSGKTVLRMTKSLHQRAAMYADREGVSLNQFIVTCLAECVGERSRPQMVVYPQLQMTGSMTLQVVGTTNVSGSSGTILSPSGTREITATSAGPSVLPLPQWRELERRHAGG